MLRVLIVDDNPLFLDSMSELLARYSGVCVVGTARGGALGLHLAAELTPDLVFVDLSMSGLGGLEVARQLRFSQPQMRVVIISLHDGADYRERAAAAGAERFVCKRDLFATLPALVGNPSAPQSAE